MYTGVGMQRALAGDRLVTTTTRGGSALIGRVGTRGAVRGRPSVAAMTVASRPWLATLLRAVAPSRAPPAGACFAHGMTSMVRNG
jgi:hypothetical protein